MANKPKITHFATSDSSRSKSINSSSPNRSRLARLYPKPKTYEQIKQDDFLRQKSYRNQWPKYPYLNIAVCGSILFGIIIWVTQNINTWWFGNSDWGLTMSTVFLSFGIAMALIFLVVAWVKYVNKLLSYFGGMVGIFWLIYTVLVIVLLVLWLSGWIGKYTDAFWGPALIVSHFIVVFSSTRRIVRQPS